MTRVAEDPDAEQPSRLVLDRKGKARLLRKDGSDCLADGEVEDHAATGGVVRENPYRCLCASDNAGLLAGRHPYDSRAHLPRAGHRVGRRAFVG